MISPRLHRFCVAPMLDWTDRHERYFLRLISRHAFLYTEMVTTGALIYGDAARHLAFDDSEHPVALQLGGSKPDEIARCAHMAQQAGYDEVNLNIGCPSDRVQSGRFGACLMAQPELVAECVHAARQCVDIPVTVKCRIGIDEHDSDEFLFRFVEPIAAAGCSTFIVHARIAILQGLSPKENRDIPPLQYDRVLRLKRRYPELEIVINGGIRTLAESNTLLEELDGVMMGREAYQNPWVLARVDEELFGAEPAVLDRFEVMQRFLPYVREELSRGTPLQHMSRHILGLFHGIPGGKAFRRHLSENAFRKDAGVQVLEDAIALLDVSSQRHARMSATGT
ncbi:MAG: tRNA dihydrouridine(20/20a) synthase DusA [Pseudomonadales bacterium]|nr:tRNA dihydrouridine(20/20a) synthase DusA [Pseudomonadales bacterium]MCP5331550.1 tRNA dihydrouridine(20/20a) synthase DusA [Pseudomonadales bacterium]MCP5343433.1 tRNA dihydrouridine(20/20a) synthase DusA [Pseudomonadales bacterium]